MKLLHKLMIFIGSLVSASAASSVWGHSVDAAKTSSDTHKTSKVVEKPEENKASQEKHKEKKNLDFKVVKVKQGDTTWEIAHDNKTTVKQIVKDNKLSNNGSLIFVDQKLKVRTNDNESNPSKGMEHVATQQTQTTQQQVQQTQATTQQRQTTQAVSQAPVASTAQTQQQTTASTSAQASSPAKTVAPQSSSLSSAEKEAKEWIAARESGGSYAATNGIYIGRYQLHRDYLRGDYSPANQERTADRYVVGRYGSWVNAKQYWQTHGWY